MPPAQLLPSLSPVRGRVGVRVDCQSASIHAKESRLGESAFFAEVKAVKSMMIMCSVASLATQPVMAQPGTVARVAVSVNEDTGGTHR